MSLPCSGKQTSSLSESRAARPHGNGAASERPHPRAAPRPRPSRASSSPARRCSRCARPCTRRRRSPLSAKVKASAGGSPSRSSARGPCTASSAYSSETSRTRSRGSRARAATRSRCSRLDALTTSRNRVARAGRRSGRRGSRRARSSAACTAPRPRRCGRGRSRAAPGAARRARPLDLDLAHVRDVEDAGRVATARCSSIDARVLDRHLPAGEGDESRAGRDVALVERRALQRPHGARC